MLVLTRLLGQRIVIQSPRGKALWVSLDQAGFWYVDDGGDVCSVSDTEADTITLDGQDVQIAHLKVDYRHKERERIGVSAPRDYLILREELIDGECAIPDKTKHRQQR